MVARPGEVAWLGYPGKKGHASAERHIQALEKVLPLLPEGSEVLVLGDAEYVTIKYALKPHPDFQPLFHFQPLETCTHVG